MINGAIDVPAHIDFVPGWWPAPDVSVPVVFDGDRCVIEGEPAVATDDRVSIHFRNESDGSAGVSLWVDDSGITAADLGPDALAALLERGYLQSGWEVTPSGATEIQGLATRAQMIVNCWSELVEGEIPKLIIPVAS